MVKLLKKALAAKPALPATARMCAQVSATIAKQRLWPLAQHGFAAHNLDNGQRDIELRWLPERRMWALWLRVGSEVYADTKPRLRHFVAGIDDILSRAKSGAEADAMRPFG